MPKAKRALMIGISGCSRSGKTTLAKALAEELGEQRTTVICQDSFASARLAARQESGWESSDSIEHTQFRQAVVDAMCSSSSHKFVVVEGFRAFHDAELVALLDRLLWFELSRATCRARRMATTRVSESMFAKHLWPRHVEYAERCFRENGPLASRAVTVLDGEVDAATVLQAAVAAIKGDRATAAVLSDHPGCVVSSGSPSPTATSTAASAAASIGTPPMRTERTLVQPAVDKLHRVLAELEPGARVGVLTLLGSLCPITLGHVQLFVEARAMLLGQSAQCAPAKLERFDSVVGFCSLNCAAHVDRKLRAKGEASLSLGDRRRLLEMAVEEYGWIAWEAREGETVDALTKSYPHLSFVPFTMNGADDVLRYRKWSWAGPAMRMITMGRPGDTQAVIDGARRAGVDLDAGHFLIGPELPDISSSAARWAIAHGDTAAAARHLHPRVLAWCRENNVWQAAPTQHGVPQTAGQ